MEKLLELVAVINRNKTKSISVIGSGNQTKIDRFYHLLAEKKVRTDDEAFALLYDDESQRNAYHKLKHQIRERLFNTAFFVDAKQTKFSSRKRAYLECQYLLCLANVLNMLKARTNMADVCKNIMKIGEKYEFTAERLTAATKLLNYYIITGQISECNKLIELITQLVELKRKETYAVLFWSKVKINYVVDRSLKLELAEEVSKYVDQLDRMKCQLSSQNLDYNITVLSMSVHMIVGKYYEAAMVLKPALDKLSSQKFIDDICFYSIAINLMACYIPLKRYEEGEKTVNRIYAQVEVESFNWFKTREMHFILYLHTKRYREAEALYKDTTTRKAYAKVPAYLKEIWTIYGAYLRILANADRIVLLPAEKASPFRITRYLNSITTFSKDKRGQNIPIIISQIILLLQQKKFDLIDDRFEAVGKYRSRYAGVEKNFRGNVFLHMLQEVTKNSFDRERILTSTDQLRSLLDTVPIDITSQGYDQEILPYEDLWEILLEAL